MSDGLVIHLEKTIHIKNPKPSLGIMDEYKGK